MKKTDLSPAVAIVWLIFVLALLGGWIANIVKAYGLLDDPLTGWFIARALGVLFAPLGVVLGYL